MTTREATPASAYFAHDSTGTFARCVVHWESDGEGKAVLHLDGRQAPRLIGCPLRLVTVPGNSAAPSDNYDVMLEDAHGNDVLQGAGANRDATQAEQAWISETASSTVPVQPLTLGDLTFKVTGAGPGRAGVAVIYVAVSDGAM